MDRDGDEDAGGDSDRAHVSPFTVPILVLVSLPMLPTLSQLLLSFVPNLYPHPHLYAKAFPHGNHRLQSCRGIGMGLGPLGIHWTMQGLEAPYSVLRNLPVPTKVDDEG